MLSRRSNGKKSPSSRKRGGGFHEIERVSRVHKSYRSRRAIDKRQPTKGMAAVPLPFSSRRALFVRQEGLRFASQTSLNTSRPVGCDGKRKSNHQVVEGESTS